MDVECTYDTSTIDIGASISHAGACMTVIEKGPNWYAFEVSDESLSKTTMGKWSAGDKINLERALTGADELDWILPRPTRSLSALRPKALSLSTACL